MTRLRGLVLGGLASLFLPAIVIVSILLDVVAVNLDEVRSLPKTYLWTAIGLATGWLLCAAVLLSSPRAGKAAAARGIAFLGVSILVWDAFRSLWLGTWGWVVGVAILEVGLAVLLWVGLGRLKHQTLLLGMALFAGVQTGVLTILHVQQVEARRVFNAVKEIAGGLGESRAPHPDPWSTRPPEATEVHDFDLVGLRGRGPDIQVEAGNPIRVRAEVGPGAELVAIPLRLTEPLSGLGLVEIRVRMLEGQVGVGFREPDSNEWSYRRNAHGAGSDWQQLYLPIFPGAEPAEVVLYSSPVGLRRVAFEVGGATLLSMDGVGPDVPAAGPGNVYHVILDGAERSVFQRLSKELPEFVAGDFQIFDEFRTASGRTHWSLPHIVGGQFYDPARGLSAEEWVRRSFEEGLFGELAAQGVATYLYPFESGQCTSGATYCLSTQDFRRELLASVSDNFILDLTFLRLLPNSLRAALIGSPGREKPDSRSWDYGFSITSRLAGPASTTTEDQILREYYYSLNLFSIDFFRRMLNEEFHRPSRGQYVYLHAMVPHAPYARDAECRFIGKEERTTENKAARRESQYICAMRLVRRLVGQLQRMGRYEEALILVHADHGSPEPPAPGLYQDRNEEDSSKWPHWLVDSISSGLLLVKWPGAEGFGTASFPAQTVDLAPTVLEHFGLSLPESWDGVALQHPAPKSERTLRFYGSNDRKLFSGLERFSLHEKQAGEWKFRGHVPAKP